MGHVVVGHECPRCDICHKMKEDVRTAPWLNKKVCSDCMGVEKFSEEEREIREVF